MAGNNVRIGALRYDIIADSSLFTQGVTKASRMSRKLAKDIAVTRTPLERYKKEIMQANRAMKAGLLDQKAYLHSKKRLKKQYYEETALLKKNSHALLLNTKAKNANAAASSRMNLANIGGAAASMFGGRGGAAVGRGIGIGAMAGGPAGIGLAAAFGGAYATARMMEEFGDLQEAATDLKVFLGEEFGEESANAFRKIARESSLTTKGLIKNARVWASYGLETDNIVDMVERLGIAAGGEREAFDNLTRAMAQVNAAGKLMGQEKNQLINAGFSLKIIADEAGVSMTNFAKAMEEGAISAEHVNNALIKATNEGGLYFGRLEKKSKTLNGQLDLLTNNFNDLFANLGESKSGFFSTILSQLNETLANASKTISQANELEKTKERTRKYEQFGRGGGNQEERFIRGSKERIGSSRREQDIRNQLFDKELFDFIGDKTGFKAITEFLSGARSFSEIFESENQLRLKRIERQRQADQKEQSAKKAAIKRGMPVPEKGTGGDPNVIADTTAENLADAAKQAAGLPGNLGPGTIDEYNFIRDKMMEDRNLAMKSLDQLKQQTKQLQIMNGEKAGHRTNRRHHPSRQALRTRLGMDPQSMMPMPLPITGFEPMGEGGVPAPQMGMSAEAQVRAKFQRDRRSLYDKWKMTDAVQTSEGSYGTTMSQEERRGYEEEGGELRRLFKRDLAKAKEQDESTNEWANILGTSFKETIAEQTRQLTGGEDKQLEGVD